MVMRSELRFGWAGGRSGFLRGLPLGRGAGDGIKDLGGCCWLKWRPGRRAGRVIDVLSQRVVVTEVDVIELPVDHDWEVSLLFLFQ